MAQLSNEQTQTSLADQIDEFMPKVVDTLGSWREHSHPVPSAMKSPSPV